MEFGGDGVLGVRLATEGNADSTAAAETSPDSTEPTSGRRRSERRVKAAVTPGRPGDSRGPNARAPVRVLRARGADAGRATESKITSASLHPARGRPAKPRVKIAPVMQNAINKSTANKASKHTLGPKLSKARKGRGRPTTTDATTCKPETETEDLSCGEDTGAVKANADNVADPDVAPDEDLPLEEDSKDLVSKSDAKKEKPKRRGTLRRKEIKKEEDENGTKKEEPAPIDGQNEDGAEPSRKRGKRGDKGPRQPKRRKKPPVQYVRCEMEGCDTVLAHPRYLQHHIKYQHLLKKKYVCDHPSCGRLFRLQKQLLRHAKHHTDQRDYICEYCARAFKSSHNLAVHRMIHTGEKPIQCEICGFTCRQKASLNWHMKKHDAEASYQFSCSICGKKFEKKDSVVAHKAKSHPEVLIAEALAANGGSVISSPIPVLETAPVVSQHEEPSVSRESVDSRGCQESEGGLLTPLQQVVLPLAPQTQMDASQNQFLQLPTCHVVQVAQQQQQQAPTLLHLTPAAPVHLAATGHPQLIQLSALPSSTSVVSADSLLTLSSVPALASATCPAPQHAAQWGRGVDEDAHIPGEGELWDRVVVGERQQQQQDVGGIIWDGSRERRKESEGIVWDGEGQRQIMLQCADVHEDSLIKVEGRAEGQHYE
ncbi:E3 ubiquitin-protein ligase ZFP91-like [Mugil cephalus]|uniref:E3 ubiquitin-protein ligase ZFP91-like n=1 Tax=Mugil cephalus TaxID=48193 RepID=UPI001FB59F67|nr:E3 ubiquitin-protein ligase ZFP91-like [Mugil cephalus]